jgi:hypothetical protein
VADLSELLNSSDPEALQKLIALRNQLNGQAPYDAEQASRQAQANDYSQLFSKQNAQDIVDQQSVPGNTAADSAEVLKDAPDVAGSAETAASEAADATPGQGLGIADVGGEGGAGEALSDLADSKGAAALAMLTPNSHMYSASNQFGTDVEDQPGRRAVGEDIVGTPSNLSPRDKAILEALKAHLSDPKNFTAEDIKEATASDDSDGDDDDSTSPAQKPNVASVTPAMVAQKSLEAQRAPSLGSAKSQNAPVGSDTSMGPPTPPTAAPQQSDDYLGSLMKSLYGASGTDALKAAQAKQHDMMQANSLSMAGKEIAAAMSRGGYQPNYEANQQINALAAQPVQALQQQQQVVKEAIDSGAKLSDLQDKAQLQNPKSPVSIAYRNMAATLNPQIAKSPGFDSMSAETIKNAQPMVDTSIKMQVMQLQRQDMANQRNMMFQQRNDLQAQQRQAQAFTQTGQMLESSRMTNPAVMQAEKDIYAAKKAQTIQDTMGGGSANNMSPQATGLLTEEIAKIASGGIPQHEEMAMLNPGALQGKLAGVWSKLSNEPTPANAGAFIKQYQDYAKGVQNDAQKVITNHYNRVINTRAGLMSPTQADLLRDQYSNRFKNEAAESNQAAPTQGYSQAQEAGIAAVMKGNNVDRNTAVQALQQAGKL